MNWIGLEDQVDTTLWKGLKGSSTRASLRHKMTQIRKEKRRKGRKSLFEMLSHAHTHLQSFCPVKWYWMLQRWGYRYQGPLWLNCVWFSVCLCVCVRRWEKRRVTWLSKSTKGPFLFFSLSVGSAPHQWICNYNTMSCAIRETIIKANNDTLTMLS